MVHRVPECVRHASVLQDTVAERESRGAADDVHELLTLGTLRGEGVAAPCETSDREAALDGRLRYQLVRNGAFVIA